MGERRQLTIGVHRDKYEFLSARKEALENALGHRVDWGTYFLILASQRPLDESGTVFKGGYGDEGRYNDYSRVTKGEVQDYSG